MHPFGYESGHGRERESCFSESLAYSWWFWLHLVPSGINILPGSFMTGQVRWAVYGGIALVVGVGLLFAARKRTLKG
jgi:hypothetical protein